MATDYTSTEKQTILQLINDYPDLQKNYSFITQFFNATNLRQPLPEISQFKFSSNYSRKLFMMPSAKLLSETKLPKLKLDLDFINLYITDLAQYLKTTLPNITLTQIDEPIHHTIIGQELDTLIHLCEQLNIQKVKLPLKHSLFNQFFEQIQTMIDLTRNYDNRPLTTYQLLQLKSLLSIRPLDNNYKSVAQLKIVLTLIGYQPIKPIEPYQPITKAIDIAKTPANQNDIHQYQYFLTKYDALFESLQFEQNLTKIPQSLQSKSEKVNQLILHSLTRQVTSQDFDKITRDEIYEVLDIIKLIIEPALVIPTIKNNSTTEITIRPHISKEKEFLQSLHEPLSHIYLTLTTASKNKVKEIYISKDLRQNLEKISCTQTIHFAQDHVGQYGFQNQKTATILRNTRYHYITKNLAFIPVTSLQRIFKIFRYFNNHQVNDWSAFIQNSPNPEKLQASLGHFSITNDPSQIIETQNRKALNAK